MINNDYKPYEIRTIYRAGHSQFWELADKAGILSRLNLKLVSMEGTDDPRVAEDALFKGEIDFICGNHITPYLWVSRGAPIVCLASPSNAVRDRIITKEPVESLAQFKAKGLRIADWDLVAPHGIPAHDRLNHILDIMRQGYAEEEPEWIELAQPDDPSYRAKAIEAVQTGKADAAFVGRGRGATPLDGVHVMDLPVLPMINGTTITTSYEHLHNKERLAERLVQAMVEAIHYARMNPEQAQKYLDTKDDRPYKQNGGSAEYVARSPIKPYPDAEGILNAYELSRMRYEEVKLTNPMALWDMSYLRALDLSGFIDELIEEEPLAVREKYGVPLATTTQARLFTYGATK